MTMQDYRSLVLRQKSTRFVKA